MLQFRIQDVQEVRQFFCFLKKSELYPSLEDDYDFRDCVSCGNSDAQLSIHEALYLNDLLTTCYSVCRKYGTAIESVYTWECE